MPEQAFLLRLKSAVVGLVAVGCLFPAPPAAAEEPAYKRVRGLTYAQPGGVALKADAYVPQSEGPHPGILLVHGGAWMQGWRGTMARFGQRLAEEGYAAVTIDYRLAPQHKFPAQIDDCREALRWMHENSELLRLDPNRIGGLGISAGAHLVTLLATDPRDATEASEQPESDAKDSSTPAGEAPKCRLQLAIGLAAPCDFRSLPEDEEGLAYWLGGTRADLPEVYRRASPAAFVTPDDPPILLVHGSKDPLVPVANPTGMAKLLREAGVDSEFLVLQGGGHGAPTWHPDSVKKIAAFLGKHLPPDESAGAGAGEDADP